MKTLSDFDVKNKKVLVKSDFNVFLKDGQIVDDFRIRASLPTIKYLIDQGAKTILITHLGRPNGRVIEELRVDPVAERLSQLINQPVKKLDDCIGPAVEKEIKEMKPGQVILLENVQFHPGERKKDQSYVQSLAKLADFFVMNSFGQAHRDYASVSGLPRAMPSCAGFLLVKEIDALSRVLDNPERPLVVVIGGIKISTKIMMIKRFLETADNLVLGGALANTVISAKGFAIGKSIVEEEMVEEVKKLQLTDTKLHLPVDAIVSTDVSGKAPASVAPIGKTKEDELILDIGPDTIDLYKNIIKQAKMIIWNGPMGYFEIEKFSSGSKEIARAIAANDGYSVVGGGESVILLNQMGLQDKINHISTGGGAMLSFLAGEKLPGIETLKQ